MITRPVGIQGSDVEVLIPLSVIERTGIVDAGERGETAYRPRPSSGETKRTGDALVAVAYAPGIGVGTEVADAADEIEPVGEEVDPFGEEEEFAGHIRLEAPGELIGPLLTLHLDETARQVGVLHGGDPLHHLDALHVIGGDGAHIHAGIDRHLSRVGPTTPIHPLEPGIHLHRDAIDEKSRPHGGGIVLRLIDPRE